MGSVHETQVFVVCIPIADVLIGYLLSSVPLSPVKRHYSTQMMGLSWLRSRTVAVVIIITIIITIYHHIITMLPHVLWLRPPLFNLRQSCMYQWAHHLLKTGLNRINPQCPAGQRHCLMHVTRRL